MLVRASWDRRVRDRLAALDLEGRLRATGTPWAEADADGTVILCQAGPPSGDPADG